ncbi:MAG: hypothetical protein QMD80_02970 [archaeon]|nr:hypothetical protein [archaeon]MDI6885667.1 hypothetical protein [archaeon]
MDEIIFLVEESVEGGYEARALGYSIYTEEESLDGLKKALLVRDPYKNDHAIDGLTQKGGGLLRGVVP